MNQEIMQIQELEQARKQRMLDKANFLVSNKKVRRSTVKESRSIWMVSSYSTPKKWYVVRWNEGLGLFVCDCPYFEHRLENCMHVYAAAIYEGSNN